jgi:Xaa-Pro aminopeptidase
MQKIKDKSKKIKVSLLQTIFNFFCKANMVFHHIIQKAMKSTYFRSLFLSLFFLMSSAVLLSQLPESKINNRLSVSFYKGRRDALRQIMPANSVMVLFASSERTFSADVDYLYHQNPDFFYFSGYPDGNAMMYIFKEAQKVEGIEAPFNEVIFTPSSDPLTEAYTGKKTGADEAMKKLGIQLAIEASKYEKFPLDLSEFKLIITDRLSSDIRESDSPTALSGLIGAFRKKAGILKSPDNLYVMLSNYIADLKNDAEQKEFIQQVKGYILMQADKVSIDPLLMRYFNSADSLSRSIIRDSIVNSRINYMYFNRLTSTLRQIKTDEEIAVIQKAIDITCSGHREVMRSATPEMSEREIQGIHEFMYKKGGAKELGFPLIIASGNNGCTLHYQDNDAPVVGNNLVLMDVGAMFSGYSADVTRTIPANGKFSPEQLAIYNIVLEAQDSAFSYCNQGIPYVNLDMIGRKVIAEGLKKLGIIDNEERVGMYYPHGISHPIGLDVHDKFLDGSLLANGMIVTIEPGIYIPVGSKCDKKWWGIAVRIEDDILIKDNYHINLSAAAPRKATDIEKLMKESSPFNKLR